MNKKELQLKDCISAVELFHNQSYQLARDHFASVKKYPIDKSLNSISVFWKAECSSF